MFYPIITKTRDTWFSAKDCPIKELISYMQKKNALRDAQIEAIKTYLYLKIECQNKPLWQLFYERKISTLEIEGLQDKVSHALFEHLSQNKAALNFYGIALALGKKPLLNFINKNFKSLDYESIFKSFFTMFPIQIISFLCLWVRVKLILWQPLCI